MAVQLPVKEAQCYGQKDHSRALDTHDIAITEQPLKQLNDVVWKCLDIIIMQSSQTPQPNKLVCKYGLSIL